MSLLILYLATALVFLALDVVMLKRVLHPLFSKHIGHMMLDAPKMGAAGVFYLLYVAGIVFFVALPAANGGSMFQAFIAIKLFRKWPVKVLLLPLIYLAVYRVDSGLIL